MQKLTTSVAFRYIDPQAREPGPSRQFVNQQLAVPAGSHLPRIGEAGELLQSDQQGHFGKGLR